MTLIPVTEPHASKDLQGLPFLAIDLGFAQRAKSCGLSEKWKPVTFGKALEIATKWVPPYACQAVLILEAPLSASFDQNWNPIPRGDFELIDSSTSEPSRRVWYSGAGAVTSLAAIHFLRLLIERTVDKKSTVHLVEGFCSRYGDPKPSHTAVSKKLRSLWKHAYKLLKPVGHYRISTLQIVDPTSPTTPPSILRVPDGFR
jgi:hypothetical protein